MFCLYIGWECGYATSHKLCQYLVYKASLKNQTIKKFKVGFQHQCYLYNTFKTLRMSIYNNQCNVFQKKCNIVPLDV